MLKKKVPDTKIKGAEKASKDEEKDQEQKRLRQKRLKLFSKLAEAPFPNVFLVGKQGMEEFFNGKSWASIKKPENAKVFCDRVTAFGKTVAKARETQETNAVGKVFAQIAEGEAELKESYDSEILLHCGQKIELERLKGHVSGELAKDVKNYTKQVRCPYYKECHNVLTEGEMLAAVGCDKYNELMKSYNVSPLFHRVESGRQDHVRDLRPRHKLRTCAHPREPYHMS